MVFMARRKLLLFWAQTHENHQAVFEKKENDLIGRDRVVKCRGTMIQNTCKYQNKLSL